MANILGGVHKILHSGRSLIHYFLPPPLHKVKFEPHELYICALFMEKKVNDHSLKKEKVVMDSAIHASQTHAKFGKKKFLSSYKYVVGL